MEARFDDGRFHNLVATPHARTADLLKWVATRRPPKWSQRPPGPARPLPLPRVTDGIRVTPVGHATVLLQASGLNVLTDPVWSERCSPVRFAGPRRIVAPGIAFETLPQIDAVA